MKAKFIFTIIAAVLMSPAFSLRAQDQDAELQKQITETIEQSLERMESLLKLEDWQLFYMDSIMTHDYTAMYDELQDLQKRKATNTDLYIQIQDRWMEQMYHSFNAVMNETQWNKYLKSGGAKAQKERDKRAAKRQK